MGGWVGGLVGTENGGKKGEVEEEEEGGNK